MTFPPSAEPIADARRVLCVAAHPDDLDFGCSGTVTFDRKLADRRAPVSQTERHADLRAMLGPMHSVNAGAAGCPTTPRPKPSP